MLGPRFVLLAAIATVKAAGENALVRMKSSLQVVLVRAGALVPEGIRMRIGVSICGWLSDNCVVDSFPSSSMMPEIVAAGLLGYWAAGL